MRLTKWFAVLLMVIIVHVALADGVYVPKIVPESQSQSLTEPTQKAAIAYANGMEWMFLQVSYKGDVSDFCWLVPTPSKPKVLAANDRIFHRCYYATAPRIHYWFNSDEIGFNIALSGFLAASPGPKVVPQKVDVLERSEVGSYDVSVLKAGDAGDLISWLQKNGYHVQPKLKPVLSDYIKRGWVFSAMKVHALVKNGQDEGGIEPLRFAFKTKEPVYPLKISSLNPGKTSILLYVIGDHRYDAKQFKTDCVVSNRSPADRRLILYIGSSFHDHNSDDMYAFLNSTKSNVYLTKLSREFNPEEMQEDIVFQKSVTDGTMHPPYVSPSFLENLGSLIALSIAVLVSLLGSSLVCVIILVMALTQRFRKQRGWLITGALLCPVASFFGVGAFIYEMLSSNNGYAGVFGMVAAVLLAVNWLRKVRRNKISDKIT